MKKKGVSIFAIVFLVGFPASSQVNPLFAPYDCRKHGEDHLFIVAEPKKDTLVDEALSQWENEPALSEDTVDGWKKWGTIENFTFGKNRGNIPAIVDIQALHPIFRDVIVQLIQQCKENGITLGIVESYRTRAKQNEYRKMGKAYTRAKGGMSKHQYGLAIDVVPLVDSLPQWDDKLLWKKIGTIGEQLGLRWGGRWRSPYDPGHFEWTGPLTASTASAQKLIGKEQLYPCLEEDLNQLVKYWKQWEKLQSSTLNKPMTATQKNAGSQ